MHSPKCLFSSVCEAAAIRRISIFTKTPPNRNNRNQEQEANYITGTRRAHIAHLELIRDVALRAI